MEAGVDTISSLSQIEDVDIVSLCAGKEAVFLGKNRRHFSDTFPVTSLYCEVEYTLTSTASVPMAMRSLSLPWPDQTRHEGAAER